jgi:DNA-binding PadR family transcriptional regulator
MPDKLRSVERLLPLKPKVLHILLAVADGPRHGYSIMQEVAERTDGQVRLWPAALYGLLRELEKIDLIVESDKRPAADEDDERRRYYRITPDGTAAAKAETPADSSGSSKVHPPVRVTNSQQTRRPRGPANPLCRPAS